ncbi:hypothetical protein FSP39_001755 [Pinctada imbricata]|uniref:Ras and EF-hand domain-containing protein n=1 Tax=Pinctada imbricata TaxID=66713 RepID=A0AA89C9M5_PINIB|nr:hypothetical protein FSP39_001755 [Pinctada imbricata]
MMNTSRKEQETMDLESYDIIGEEESFSLNGSSERIIPRLNLPPQDDNDFCYTKKSFQEVASHLNLSSEEVEIMFSALDSDDDGVIRKSDLTFESPRHNSTPRQSNAAEDPDLPTYSPAFDSLANNFAVLNQECQEQVIDLYQHLHASEYPELLQSFESIILGVLKDVRHYQVENERLEKSFKREKEQHEKHLRQLEEEMDKEIQRAEEACKLQEQEKISMERAEIRKEVEKEIQALQQNLAKLQQGQLDPKEREIDEQLKETKSKLDEMMFENRQVKSELTDAQTNLALVRSELASVRQQLKEKSHDFVRVKKETVMDYIKEQDNLTRQLHLLHDANKKLHDTNDDLRQAIETKRTMKRNLSGTSNVSSTPSTMVKDYLLDSSRDPDRRGSVMSDYVPSHSGPPSVKSYNLSPSNSLVEDGGIHNVSVSSYNSPRLIRARLPRDETCEEDNALDDLDSGHSTLREHNDLDTESEVPNVDDESLRQRRRGRLRAGHHIPEADEPESHDELETETESTFPPTEARMYKVLEQNRLGNPNLRSSRSSLRSRDSPRNRLKRMNTSQESLNSKSMRDPERMYKVVLAGDAAVGKSSFIMRLCKGKFVQNLSSTLGVDFQTKVLEVDGRTIALQLWDTAGQERFRSIAKSYFRRADGVLLLYDCSYERSFLSIRDWVESIEESSQKKIPIMLCGNKSDLREDAEKIGRKVVKYDDGQRLAREFDGLFIETSAKEGCNITEAVTELSRILATNEDIEVKASGLQLHDTTFDSKSSGCCGR